MLCACKGGEKLIMMGEGTTGKTSQNRCLCIRVLNSVSF